LNANGIKDRAPLEKILMNMILFASIFLAEKCGIPDVSITLNQDEREETNPPS
jgi:hypothetical protein